VWCCGGGFLVKKRYTFEGGEFHVSKVICLYFASSFNWESSVNELERTLFSCWWLMFLFSNARRSHSLWSFSTQLITFTLHISEELSRCFYKKILGDYCQFLFQQIFKFWILFKSHLIDPKFDGDHEYLVYFVGSSMVKALSLTSGILPENLLKTNKWALFSAQFSRLITMF
jgi:hypothetical protein